jgi:hypothetical protein
LLLLKINLIYHNLLTHLIKFKPTQNSKKKKKKKKKKKNKLNTQYFVAFQLELVLYVSVFFVRELWGILFVSMYVHTRARKKNVIKNLKQNKKLFTLLWIYIIYKNNYDIRHYDARQKQFGGACLNIFFPPMVDLINQFFLHAKLTKCLCNTILI